MKTVLVLCKYFFFFMAAVSALLLLNELVIDGHLSKVSYHQYMKGISVFLIMGGVSHYLILKYFN